MNPSTLSAGRLLVLVGAVLALLVGLVTLPKPARAEAQQAPETATIEFQPLCWVNSGATPPPIVTVKIVGHSFDPNIKVNVQDLHNPQTFNTASTDANGMFTTALNVSIVQGGNTIRVSDAAGEHDLAQAVFNSCNYGKATARLLGACTSDTAPTLHLVGTGWAPSPTDALIEILIDGTSDLVDPIPPPSNGNFDVTRVVAKDLSPGDHGISFNQNGYQGSVQVVEEYAQQTLHIGSDCPGASVTPTCAPTGASPDRMSLTLSGTAFDPTADLHIVFDPLGVPQEFVYQYPVPPTPDPYATGATPAPPTGDFGPISIDPFARPAGDYIIELIQRGSGDDITHDWVTTFRSPCLQPALATPDPDCGDAVTPGVEQQYSITVTGTDFVPDQGVTIVFDPDDAAGSDYPPTAFTGSTDANGGVYAAISPGYRPPGFYRILAYQDTVSGHFEASTTFNVPCIGPPISPPPTLPPGSAVISVNPTCAPVAEGQPGAYTLSLTGGGFQPGPVTVVLDPDGTPFTGTVGADVSGYVSASFVADGKPIGTYRLQVYQDNDGTHIEADTTLTVPCQTLTINPTCAAPADGLAGAYAIVASGIGFDAGPVDLVFDPTGLAPAATQVQADATGAFTAPLTLTGKPAGVYDLVASQESSYGLIAQASAQLLVPCGAVVVRITPETGPRGFVPTVEGFGFPPNTTLTLKWDVGIGSAQTVTVLTDALGSFSRQIVIYQHDFLGLRHVIVADPANPLAYADVTATYLVAAAPIQPPFSADDTAVPSPEPVIFQR